jgi:hypothetical protein
MVFVVVVVTVVVLFADAGLGFDVTGVRPATRLAGVGEARATIG